MPKSTVSVATINKEHRHLKAALRKARERGYLPVVPTFRMLKEPKKLPLYVTPEHFAAIYQACDCATMPEAGNYSAGDWWRAFATMNANRLPGDALQALVSHKSYSTTQRYINVARQLDQSAQALYVPDVATKRAAV